MTELNKAPLLIVAGGHDETSLAWPAVEDWLARDPNHQVLHTVRTNEDWAVRKVEELDGRYGYVKINEWGQDNAISELRRTIVNQVGDKRAISGVVHAVAWAPAENFRPVSEGVDPVVRTKANEVTALSFERVIKAARENLRPRAGVVTFCYEEDGRFTPGYGLALSGAKILLNHLLRQAAVELGRSEVPARTLGIITGYVDSYAGRGVAAYLAHQKREAGQRTNLRTEAVMMGEAFAKESALSYTTPDGQRQAAGKLAAEFVVGGPIWDQVTGEIIRVNAGHSIIKPNIMPEGTS